MSEPPQPTPSFFAAHRVPLIAGAVAAAILLAAGVAWAVWPSAPAPEAAAGPTPTGATASASATPAASASGGASVAPSGALVAVPAAGGTDLPPPRPATVASPPSWLAVPTTPTDLYVGWRGPGTLDYGFSWSDGFSNATGFTVYFTDGFQVNVPGVAYDRHGLPADTDICFTVDAYNAAGHSAAAPWRCFHTAPPPPPPVKPAAPTNLVVSTSFSTAYFDWDDNADNENGVRIYTTRGGESQPTVSYGGGPDNHYQRELDRGVQYCFWITNYNTYGESAPSNTVCLTLVTLPAAPTNLIVTVDGTTLHLQWTDNSDNEVDFSVGASPGAPPSFPPANSTSWDVTGLTPGTQVHVQVRARNQAGSSAPASAVVTIPAA